MSSENSCLKLYGNMQHILQNTIFEIIYAWKTFDVDRTIKNILSALKDIK
jgi:hypothetical protein